MKNKLWIACLLGIATLMNSCIDDFLSINPKNLQTETTAFQTYDNFATYSWGLYSIFPAATTAFWGNEGNQPWITNNTQTNGSIWAYQKVTESTGNANWDFSYIRRVNLMLDNIDGSSMSDKEKKHWRSVGLFFRSLRYFQLMSKYGDIPWAEHVVTEADEDVIFGKRESRDVAAANILRDLQYAKENINANGDGPNTINKSVVLALISRFGLFEGTWRKYHGLGNSDAYLKECVDASEELVVCHPKIHSNYDDLFNSDDLSGMDGILLYKSYVSNILEHYMCRYTRASGYTYELCKMGVNLYLCSDGRPISTSPLFSGDKTPYDEFRNRDRRLLYTVLPPSRVYKEGSPQSIEWRFLKAGETITIGATTKTVTKEDSVLYREYIDLLGKISEPGRKSLPVKAWNNTLATSYTPRFRSYPEGITPFSGRHGYWYYRAYNTSPEAQSACEQDLPIFRMGEVLLNYAEAACELGSFNQEIADKTINKLRVRANINRMIVDDINEKFDLERDQTVNPLLWEIRRERTVELMGESFSFDDIRRWKKGEYFNIQKKGCWVKNVEFNNTLRIEGYSTVAESKDKEGYVIYLDKPLGWLEHYYLYPIPMNDLVLNPQLKQNPGYNSPK